MNIVILSNQSFFQELKTNKWQIATRLSKRGHNVIFIDPPLRLKAFKRFFTNFGRKDSCGVKVFSLFRPSLQKDISKTSFILDDIFTWFTYLLIKIKTKGAVVLWIYHIGYPNLEKLINMLKPKCLIYDKVDEYSEFPEYRNHKDWIKKREKWLLEKCSICFASALTLFDSLKKYCINSHYTPNGGAFEIFSKNPKVIPADIKDIPRPVIGFSGALDDFKVDTDLVLECAKKYPKFSFVLIGPRKVSTNSDFKGEALDNCKNVYFLGEKKFTDLPSYFYNFDAYFIPYVLSKYTMGVFPTKFFDSLACGLPTIVTNLPSYKNYSDNCYIGKTNKEFVDYLSISLKEDSVKKRKERVKLASENSWDGKLDKQLSVISEAIGYL